MKKTISVVMACILMFVLVFTPVSFLGEYDGCKVQAAPKQKAEVWNGEADTSWFTGNQDNYDIYTAEELAGLGKLVRKGEQFYGVTINLKKDITLNDVSDWKKWGEQPPKNVWNPIGKKGGLFGRYPFCGCFNGQGHTISGLYVDNSATGFLGGTHEAGLFAFVADAVIENLKIKYSYVSGSDAAGTLVGLSQNSYIIDVCAEKCVVRSGESAGGLVGRSMYFSQLAIQIAAFMVPVVIAGVMFNPLLFVDTDGNSKGYAMTCLYGCSVNGVKLSSLNSNSTANGGSLVGGGGYDANTCVGIKECYAANVTFDCGGTQGYFVGNKCEPNEFVEIMSGYWYKCKNSKNRKNASFADADSVTEVDEATIQSKEFAEKMGSQFKYSKGKAPKCRMKFSNKT